MYELCISIRGEHGNFNEADVRQFQNRCKKWIQSFLTVYHTTHVTPYMHVLTVHVPELLMKYGSIAYFTQQGLEKLNDMTTKMYFRATNHHKNALLQMLTKRARLEITEICDT